MLVSVSLFLCPEKSGKVERSKFHITAALKPIERKQTIIFFVEENKHQIVRLKVREDKV